jgi:SOS response regulatory protein OraA/RecX
MEVLTDEEKRKLSRKMLEKNGYSDEEIAKIIKLSFGDKKDSNKGTNANQN